VFGGELPYALAQGQRERDAAAWRLEQARRAHGALAGELREAEAQVMAATGRCHQWATRVVLVHGEALAAELAELRGRQGARGRTERVGALCLPVGGRSAVSCMADGGPLAHHAGRA
jgi:hypothetical protein